MYAKIRAAAPKAGPFVDQILTSALADPVIIERLLGTIRRENGFDDERLS